MYYHYLIKKENIMFINYVSIWYNVVFSCLFVKYETKDIDFGNLCTIHVKKIKASLFSKNVSFFYSFYK